MDPMNPEKKMKSAFRRRLPDDIEANMLARLPVKTLKRFQCASKNWYSLISSSHFRNQFCQNQFRRAQDNKNKSPLLLTVNRNGEKLSFVTYQKSKEGTLTVVDNFSETLPPPETDRPGLFSKPLPPPNTKESVGGKLFMQSCEGFVCLSSCGHSAQPIIVMNPSTYELIFLPPTAESDVRVGFGYTLSSHEFKVVRFFRDVNIYFEEPRERTCCEVFTLGTSHWRKAGNLPFHVCEGTAPFLHGAVHCLPQTNPSGVRDTDVIAVLDIETEEYRDTIPLPPIYYSLGNVYRRRGYNFMRLMKLRGSLGLIFFGELSEPSKPSCILDLWLLKDYNGREWVKGYTIDVSSVFPYPNFFWAYPTDNIGEDEEEEEDILLNCSDNHNGILDIKLLG